MIIIRLKGGLGNQMFQYALGRQLATQLQTELKLDLSSLLDRSRGDFVYRDYDLPVFNVTAEVVHSASFLRAIYRLRSSRVTQLVRRRVNRGRSHIKEAHFHFQADLLDPVVDNAVYEGWFQSPRYFEDVGDALRQEFTFREPLLPVSAALSAKIQRTNSICLNVRRTDFLQVSNLNTTNRDYFLRAVEHMAAKIAQPVFYIFSDDIEWCRENLSLNYPLEVVDHTHKGKKFSNYLRLMTTCKHFIIPNSSFAWWAVWLNQNEDKEVIAPRNWFNDPTIDTADLVPESWIRL